MKKINNFTKKIDFLLIFKYILCFFAFFVLNYAGINEVVYPFAFSFLFAIVWCNQNPYILSCLYVGSSFLATFSLVSVFSSLCTVVVLLITYFIHSKFKKPIKNWLMAIYCVLSQAVSLYFGLTSSTLFIFPILSILLGILFFFAVVKFFQAIIVRGFSSNLSSIEIACGAIILLALSCGMAGIDIYGFSIIKVFATFLILISCYAFDMSTCLMSAGVMGVGAMMHQNEPVYVCAFIIWALVVCLFKYRNKVFPVLGILLCEATLGFYFSLYGDYTWQSGISVIIGAIVFLLIPSKKIDEIAGFFSSSSDRFAMRNIVNRNREHLSRRLIELSDIFSEMDKVFRSMIKGGLSIDDAKKLLTTEVREQVCAGCPEINRCHRMVGEETSKLFSEFVSIAFERGRVGVLDIPPNLTSRCNKTTQIIANINELCEQYKKYAGVMTSLDASKVLIAEQLSGISGIMKSLSAEVSKNISFDAGREKKIMDELSINNIVCSDVVIYEQNMNIVNATIIVREDCLNIEKIEKISSKICCCHMRVVGSLQSPKAGWVALSIATAPKYDVAFGTASMTKTGSDKSGDSFSVIRIENDKIMIALCDGMGSGVKAEKASSLAMGLVENFYKAGFQSDTILSCVNKLLAIGSDEVFSALDMCVVDLKDGTADLIKLGAPCGFVRRDGRVDVVEGSALPMGIVGEIQPFNKKIVLSQNDMIILCTDGISDSFMSIQDLSDFIAENSFNNPQNLADMLIKKALENCKDVALDDMSCVIARIFRS